MLLTLATTTPGDALPTGNHALIAATAPSTRTRPLTRTAGLFVPKRVRLIIRYQRTALV